MVRGAQNGGQLKSAHHTIFTVYCKMVRYPEEMMQFEMFEMKKEINSKLKNHVKK